MASPSARGGIRATGAVGHAVNVAVFLALYLTWWYPAFEFTSDAVLLFYGASILVAAGRVDGGCEVLALSNWILRREDEVGCVCSSRWITLRVVPRVGATRRRGRWVPHSVRRRGMPR